MRAISLTVTISLTILTSLPGATEAGVYQWEDSQGVVHFTDDQEKIPARYRKKAMERAGDEERQAPAADATKKPAPSAIPDTAAAETSPKRELWQGRFRSLRSEKAMLENRLTVKRQELTDAQWRKRKFGKPGNRSEVTEIDEQISRDETRIKELDQALADLDIEASKAAVPLEWRR